LAKWRVGIQQRAEPFRVDRHSIPNCAEPESPRAAT
jgi:hypothetical protein